MFSCRVFLVTIIALMLPFAHTTCDQLVASVNQYCEAQRNATDIAINTTIEKMFQEQTESMMTAIEEKVKQRSLQLTERSEERYQEIKREQTESMMTAIEEKVKQRSQQLIERSEERYQEIKRELQELRRQRESPEGWYKGGNGLLYQFSNSQKPGIKRTLIVEAEERFWHRLELGTPRFAGKLSPSHEKIGSGLG